MTKSVVEQFAEIIEMLILAIEAQINGAPLPNRMAASMAALVRKSLEKFNASVANAIARVMAGALPPAAPRTSSRPRAKTAAKPQPWSKRLRGWLPNWFAAEPQPPQRETPRPTDTRVGRPSSPTSPHRPEAASPPTQPEPRAAGPIPVASTIRATSQARRPPRPNHPRPRAPRPVRASAAPRPPARQIATSRGPPSARQNGLQPTPLMHVHFVAI